MSRNLLTLNKDPESDMVFCGISKDEKVLPTGCRALLNRHNDFYKGRLICKKCHNRVTNLYKKSAPIPEFYDKVCIVQERIPTDFETINIVNSMADDYKKLSKEKLDLEITVRELTRKINIITNVNNDLHEKNLSLTLNNELITELNKFQKEELKERITEEQERSQENIINGRKQSELSECDKINIKLNTRTYNLERWYTDAKKQINQLTTECNVTNSQLNDKILELNTTKNTLSEIQLELNILKNKGVNTESESLAHKVNDLENNLSNKENEILILKGSNKAKESIINELKQNIVKLNITVTELEHKKEESKVERNTEVSDNLIRKSKRSVSAITKLYKETLDENIKLKETVLINKNTIKDKKTNIMTAGSIRYRPKPDYDILK
jgi:chromosome segregation ATPase